jgi:hypothetical protein
VAGLAGDQEHDLRAGQRGQLVGLKWREKRVFIFASAKNATIQGCKMVYIFKPKIPMVVNFGASENGKGWYLPCLFGIYSGNLVFMYHWKI